MFDLNWRLYKEPNRIPVTHKLRFQPQIFSRMLYILQAYSQLYSSQGSLDILPWNQGSNRWNSRCILCLLYGIDSECQSMELEVNYFVNPEMRPNLSFVLRKVKLKFDGFIGLDYFELS